jgi:hypothetical protein
VKRVAVSVVAFATLLLAPGAFAAQCGLPDAQPLWIDFGAREVESPMARPGTILAVSTGAYPAEVRARGAKTIYWDMNLRSRVGTPTAPADPALMDERANRLFVFAASQSQCATPWIALNELFGGRLETPWTPSNAQYRANVLEFLRALARRGARPFLLLNSPAYTGSPEAIAWWRAVAEVSDLVRQVYVGAPSVWTRGPIRGNRHLRIAFRRAVANLVSIGIPVSKVGIMLGFQSAPGTGGRDRLEPREAWFEVIKWQALAAREVAREMRLATVWSWGWGTYSEAGRDADKPDAACVYLWTRNPLLCDGPAAAGPSFDVSRKEGQLILPSGAQCKIGRHTISASGIARLRTMVQDRDVAYTALLARLAESTVARVSSREVRAAEAAVVATRFGRSQAAYRAALAKAGANVGIARSVLADQLRRREIGARLRVPRPSAGAIAGFYLSYPDLLARDVHAAAAPWWLGGRTRGIALSTTAPSQLFAVPTGRKAIVRSPTGRYEVRPLSASQSLGSVPLASARATIAAVLTEYARSNAVLSWSAARQEVLLRDAICRRDDLPMAASADLEAFLPFLAVTG